MVEKTLTKELFPNRTWEREILNPLVGKSMLELGNKRKGDMVYKAVFESLGFRHVSIDMNGSDGALPFDLREPLDLGTFDMVTNFGTSEHVSVNDYDGQVACWQNIVNATHDGSVLVSVTPRPNVSRWSRHGRWYPEEEFYNLLASLNGFEAERVYRDKYLIYARLVRHTVTDFRMPTKGMFINDASLKMAGCS